VVSAQWSNFLGNPGQGKLYFSDFNGDGRDDLMVLETNGNLSARINTGTYYDGGRVVSAQWSNFLGNPGQGKLYFA
jgi:outer membrane protein assembly factor BamB